MVEIEEGGGKRYALLQAVQDSEYAKKVYGGYFSVFVAAFGEEGERWDLFMVVEGEFPAIDELQNYHGFVISGSPHDAYANDSWILDLCFLLQTLDTMEKKVLGICFGHQVLCRALGGKVGRAETGWDIGVRKVQIMESSEWRFVEDMGEMPSNLSIIECHQDEVWEIPHGAQIIGFSDKTGVEIFAIGDHILGIQGHPEYSKDILYGLVDHLLNNYSIRIMIF
ncbi:gamma-glutamyl peptidase 2-like isoform X2 [Momordica charantia]|uniref:Gamma-glutamyl peptidase 2-like isoform X2 n=1 Tax=Momordica charantia TaxID=3673 RepID=A0A6J1C197_MOMCH|nr:gamma-glutamyl peptidase 2-like isoform X2 [Momordica charantia]